MYSPHCGHPDDREVDSRELNEGHQVRRRRECLASVYGRLGEVEQFLTELEAPRHGHGDT